MSKLQQVSILLCLFTLLVLAGCATSPEQENKAEQAAQANASYGLDLLNKQRYDSAEKKFKRALHHDKTNQDANWGLALLAQRAEQPRKAGRYFKKAIKDAPRPAVLNSYGVFLCTQDQTQQALKYFKQAGKDARNTDPATSYVNAGLCMQRANKVDQAYDFYRKALKIDEQQPRALLHLAEIQYQQQRYLSARAFIERADSLVELKPKYLLLAAKNEYKMQNKEGAQQYLQRYNDSDPDKVLSYRTLARISND